MDDTEIYRKGNNAMEKLVYNATEMAEILGISRSYAYQLIKQKKVPVIEIGNKMMVPKKQLQRWIDGELEL